MLMISVVSCSEILVKTELIRFEIDERANFNHPIAMDLLIIYDEELLKKLSELTATDWFKQRSQFKEDNSTTLSTWEWELVPGQKNFSFRMPSNTKEAQGVLLFVHYKGEGEHRKSLDSEPLVTVRLEEEKVVVQPLKY